MEVIGGGKELSSCPKIRAICSQLQLFKLIYPRGGQANDGYTFGMNVEFAHREEVIQLLDFLAVEYRLGDQFMEKTEEEKQNYAYYHNKIGFEENSFIIFKPLTKFKDGYIYLTLYECGVSIKTAWLYEVELSDVVLAFQLEKALLDSNKFPSLFLK